jgi:hypothetical protein
MVKHRLGFTYKLSTPDSVKGKNQHWDDSLPNIVFSKEELLPLPKIEEKERKRIAKHLEYMRRKKRSVKSPNSSQ